MAARRRTVRSLSSVREDWPPDIRLLVRAADRECPPGHAGALRELTSLALTKVPARGVFDPTSRGEHEIFAAVDAIAARHLGLNGARAAWKRALRDARLEPEARDRVEGAAQEIQGVAETAYFYTGLAFGLVSTGLFFGRR